MQYDKYASPLPHPGWTTTCPTSLNCPRHRNRDCGTPSDIGPLSAKGVGEPPIIPTAAAIGNAIKDAVGVRMTDIHPYDCAAGAGGAGGVAIFYSCVMLSLLSVCSLAAS